MAVGDLSLMPVAADTARRIVGALNCCKTFCETFEAVRAWLPNYKLDELSTLRVTVVAIGEDVQWLDRERGEFTHTINIGVQKKLEANDDGEILDQEIDRYVRLAEQIRDYLLDNEQRLPLLEGSVALTGKIEPLVDPGFLFQDSVFLSVIEMTYKSHRKFDRNTNPA